MGGDLEAFIRAGCYEPGSASAPVIEASIQYLRQRGLGDDAIIATLRDPAAADYLERFSRVSSPPMTARDLAAAVDIEVQQVLDVRTASGLPPVGPDEPAFWNEDIPAFRLMHAGLLIFSWDELLAFIRVMGSSMSRVADAANYLFLEDIERPLIEAGGSGVEIVKSAVEAQSLALDLVWVLQMLIREHLELSVNRHRESISRAGYDDQMVSMVVGFVDLVGYTSRSLKMGAQELAELVTRFEALAQDTVSRLGGRLVKFIGDELMFVTVDPAGGIRIATEILRVFGSDPSLTPRGGMAYGPVLARVGDYFGSVVNLAARLVDQSVPGEVLVTTELAEEAQMSLEPAGRRMLKGFNDPVSVASLTLRAN